MSVTEKQDILTLETDTKAAALLGPGAPEAQKDQQEQETANPAQERTLTQGLS
jgi:hypothetical protein